MLLQILDCSGWAISLRIIFANLFIVKCNETFPRNQEEIRMFFKTTVQVYRSTESGIIQAKDGKGKLPFNNFADNWLRLQEGAEPLIYCV